MGSIARHTVVVGQDIKVGAISHPKILDHTLGSQEFGTTAEIIIYGTQIKDDIIGSEHIQSCAISYGTQIINDLIGSEHLDAGAIAYGTQIKDDLITSAKFSELQLHGTVIGVGGAGTYIQFAGSGFGGTPDIVITPETGVGAGTYPYIETKTHGSAKITLTGGGTIVCDYFAIGSRP